MYRHWSVMAYLNTEISSIVLIFLFNIYTALTLLCQVEVCECSCVRGNSMCCSAEGSRLFFVLLKANNCDYIHRHAYPPKYRLLMHVRLWISSLLLWHLTWAELCGIFEFVWWTLSNIQSHSVALCMLLFVRGSIS